MTKWISQCKVGDMVTIGSKIYDIVSETKTQFKVELHPADGTKSDTQRITKNNGKVVGAYSHSWAYVLDGTPEEFEAKIQAVADAKKAKAQERSNAWNEKVAAVKARNTNIIITDEGMGGLKKAVMIDSKDQPMIVYFSAEPETFYTNYSQPPVEGVRIRCSTWRNDGWRDEVRFGFSQTDARGETIEAALIDLVAGHYWN